MNTERTLDLFSDRDWPENPANPQQLGSGSFLLPGFARTQDQVLVQEIELVIQRSPFRQMITPGGQTMSVALTNCGPLGWVTDRKGYRYSTVDPMTDQPWPDMPDTFRALAREAALAAGFAHFEPDACLINCYVPGSRMGLHQDRDEQDFSQPIVSVSLGISAVFQFGGLSRKDRPQRIQLAHGDVVVWGGEDRLRFHGILPIKDDSHPLLGVRRINFTFRRAR